MKTIIPAKPEHVTWTDDQWKAIFAKDQDILVAAAAGSGKTAVLVERIIQRILSDEDPVDVDQLLVVTFTNAAAAEMRHRIGEALAQAIDKQPDANHLRKQLSLLNSASISTLHSFCLEVVRKYYYLVDIDPGFRLADDTEGELLRDEVLDDLFEEQYGKEDNERFYRLVDTFTGDRSDTELQELILKLFDFSRSHPSPNQWLDELVEMYHLSEDAQIDDLSIIQVLNDDIEMQLNGAKKLLEEAYEMTKWPGGPAPRAENYLDDLQIVDRLQQATKEGWEALYEAMNSWKFTRAKTCRGDQYDPVIVEDAKDSRDKARGILNKLKEELFSREPEYFLRDMREMHPIFATLVETVKLFAIRFKEMKRDKALVDFSDLEYFTLDILSSYDATGSEVRPSEIANHYRKQFKEVLVDEYQDVNMVQEAIIQLVSADGNYDGNLFMVGDVKQSIYRFRLAEPNLFLDKYGRFSPDGKGTGLRIDLSRNFRSRGEVLAGTNFIFKQIMGINVGEIDYNEDAELVQGASYPSEDPYPAELILIDQKSEEEQDHQRSNSDEEAQLDPSELEQSVLEARYLANRIRKIIDEQKPVYDVKTGRERPTQYKDIVILLRSMAWAPEIMEEFRNNGIPIYANLSKGYFEATEIAIMMSLLQIIDNPDQDIPLASVLRSPIVQLNEDELAQVRMASREGSYYLAAKQFARKEVDARLKNAQEKVARLIANLHKWRDLARRGALSDLIWQLYRDTGFYEFAGGLPGGKQRQANLRALYDRARQYEETSFRGLFRFLRFIERMRERGNDLGDARAVGEQEDVVRMMTIHSSKGLEFPIVFVAGMGRQFNMQDINSSFLYDKDFGLATKYIHPEKRISYPSLPQLALKRKKKIEMVAEEMRVLYVALTRAKEKLILVGTMKDAEKELEQWLQVRMHKGWLLSEFERAKAQRYIDWVGPALLRHRDAEIVLDKEKSITVKEEEVAMHPSRWKVELIPLESFDRVEMNIDEHQEDWQTLIKEGRPNIVESTAKTEINSRLGWTYAHLQATKKMSKQSVSELKRIAETRDKASATDMIRMRSTQIFKQPKFLEKKGISPAERGTAMHTVMQHVPLNKLPTKTTIAKLLEQLVYKEIMTEEQKNAVNVEQIIQFFQSELGERFFHAKKVMREVPFTLGIAAKEVYSDWDGEDESVVVQGVIDCILEEDDQFILIDYKTDAIHGRFPGGFEQARNVLKKRYETQVEVYTRAFEEISKKRISERYLYFFDVNQLLKI